MSDATDFTAALADLKRLIQADDAPALTYGDGSTIDTTRDLDAILENNKWARTYTNATLYRLGQKVLPSVRNGLVYQVVTPGTSGGAEPTWPLTTEGQVTSGVDSPLLTFQEAGAEPESVYNLRAAAYAALDLKCMKATNHNQYMSDGRATASSYLFLNLQRQRDRYQPMGLA